MGTSCCMLTGCLSSCQPYLGNAVERIQRYWYEQNHRVVRTFADGNCGYNAFSLWFYNLFLKDKKSFSRWLENDSLKKFRKKLLSTIRSIQYSNELDIATQIDIITSWLAHVKEDFVLFQEKLSDVFRQVAIDAILEDVPLQTNLINELKAAYIAFLRDENKPVYMVENFRAGQEKLRELLSANFDATARSENNTLSLSDLLTLAKNSLPQAISSIEQNFLQWLDQNQSAYWDVLRQNKIYAGESELACLAASLGLEVEFHLFTTDSEVIRLLPDNRRIATSIAEEQAVLSKQQRKIELFHRGDHWDWICRTSLLDDDFSLDYFVAYFRIAKTYSSLAYDVYVKENHPDIPLTVIECSRLLESERTFHC